MFVQQDLGAAYLDSLDLGTGMRMLGSCWPSTTLPVKWRTDSTPAAERTSRKSDAFGLWGNAPATCIGDVSLNPYSLLSLSSLLKAAEQ